MPSYVKPVCSVGNGSEYGWYTEPVTGREAFHSGLDFDVDPGFPVFAALSGRVISAELRGTYGLAVEIDHGHGHQTRYGHLSALAVVAGQWVACGATLGWSGATGKTAKPTLHFEIWRSDVVMDPRHRFGPNRRCAATG